MFKVFCASCEKQIEQNQLSVLIAYVYCEDAQRFAFRTVDVFHIHCWNRVGAPNANPKEGPHEQPPSAV